MRKILCAVGLMSASLGLSSTGYAGDDLSAVVKADYDAHLDDLFKYFHQNAELSLKEFKTSKRLGDELEAAGFDVHRGIAVTGIVAILKNGPGPLVMMRADMDGLPVEEKSGLEYASVNTQEDFSGTVVPVMHACGHDVHITSLVGTARLMAARRDQWSGTLMLVGQPAEERVLGARRMMAEGIYDTFGKPDYAMAFHVTSGAPTGKLIAVEGSPYSGADTVDIIVPGVGAHGASPHRGVDPVVLGAQIVGALQTVVSRSKSPRDPGVITVGSFHAGTKHNIISDNAHLQLTVRSESREVRQILLDGIKRVAENMGRVAGLPEDNLPQVIVSEESVPPMLNNIPLTKRLRAVWQREMGDDILLDAERKGMGAEDFPLFVDDPYIPSTYFGVGGTDPQDFVREANGGARVPSHHSPLFKVEGEESVRLGVEATVVGLMELLKKG